ncbi:MAG: hypothetical protein GY759_10025, partial [Chloroflexi bacterium]|nr:hypothetical protein [Chloroflexota bacterium]
PFSVMPFRPSLQITVTGHSTDTVVYIDVQIQPTNTAHLRYSLTSLDWPYDDQGQIQDLDDSTDDIKLIPVLTFNSSSSPALAHEYSLSVSQLDNSDPNYPDYSVWAPLQPVVETGNISAFSARLAFKSAEMDAGIDLYDGKMIWTTQAALDSCVAGSVISAETGDPVPDACADISTESSIIASYTEDWIRVTGLSVSEYKDVEVGLFGTSAPATSSDANTPDEDTTMFTLMSAGLTGSFLYYMNPDLDTMDTNFSDPGASSPYAPTWGIDPTTMHVQVDHFT